MPPAEHRALCPLSAHLKGLGNQMKGLGTVVRDTSIECALERLDGELHGREKG